MGGSTIRCGPARHGSATSYRNGPAKARAPATACASRFSTTTMRCMSARGCSAAIRPRSRRRSHAATIPSSLNACGCRSTATTTNAPRTRSVSRRLGCGQTGTMRQTMKTTPTSGSTRSGRRKRTSMRSAGPRRCASLFRSSGSPINRCRCGASMLIGGIPSRARTTTGSRYPPTAPDGRRSWDSSWASRASSRPAGSSSCPTARPTRAFRAASRRWIRSMAAQTSPAAPAPM